MSFKDLPPDTLPREKLLARGAGALSDAELLAILLRTGLAGCGVLQLAHERGLWVIEDCAHALGARWQGRLLGTLGDAAVFSFERSKIITCIHGGMAVVHDPYAADQLARLAERAPLPDDDSLREQLASGQLLALLPAWQPAPIGIHLVTPRRDAQPAKVRYAIEALRRSLLAP